MAPPPKIVAGRYELKEEIARGAFACVYRAWDMLLKRMVAVKLYVPGVHAAISQQEIALQSTCQHPNVMPLHDAGTDPTVGRPYVVMSLYPGEDLDAHIRRCGPMPVKKALRVADQVCNALDYLWRRRQPSHGDVKPGNIWLTADGSAVLMDFNLRGALVIYPDRVGGTPGYTAPEAYQGRRDPRSDVFSLGCVLYYMLTGQPAFDPGQDPPRRLPARPSARRVDLYPWIDGLLKSALALDPEKRYQSAAEMHIALRCPPPGARPWLWPVRLWLRGSLLRRIAVAAAGAILGGAAP